jgi:hypothetical protein
MRVDPLSQHRMGVFDCSARSRITVRVVDLCETAAFAEPANPAIIRNARNAKPPLRAATSGW